MSSIQFRRGILQSWPVSCKKPRSWKETLKIHVSVQTQTLQQITRNLWRHISSSPSNIRLGYNHYPLVGRPCQNSKMRIFVTSPGSPWNLSTGSNTRDTSRSAESKDTSLVFPVRMNYSFLHVWIKWTRRRLRRNITVGKLWWLIHLRGPLLHCSFQAHSDEP